MLVKDNSAAKETQVTLPTEQTSVLCCQPREKANGLQVQRNTGNSPVTGQKQFSRALYLGNSESSLGRGRRGPLGQRFSRSFRRG